MPQYPFVQVMALSGFVAVAATGATFAVGATAGARAGRTLLRGSLIGVLLAFAACFVWGAASGDLQAFNARAEDGVWLQTGAFFAIMYSTGYRFASSYLRDKVGGVAAGAGRPTGDSPPVADGAAGPEEAADA